MQGTPQRWARVSFGILTAVVLSTLIYLIVSSLIVERPWWLAVGAALALPEIARGALSEFGNPQSKGRANHKATQIVTRTLCTVAMLLGFYGVASM